MLGFERRRTDSKFKSVSPLYNEMTAEQRDFYDKVIRAWNFYEGYHWEELPPQEMPEVTINYCRAFVDKFVAFELGKAFTFTTSPEVDEELVTTEEKESDRRTLFDFLEDVWEDNNQYAFCVELGQMKSITSKAWVKVSYESPEELKEKFSYDKYPQGRIRLDLLPTHTVFPEYDPHDRTRITAITVMYEYEKITRTAILNKPRREKVLYKQVWTDKECVIYDGKEEPVVYGHQLGFIPFVEFKNAVLAGQTDCKGDLDDIIPLNTEYNLKKSNMSETIDYHSAPITIVYGAKIGNLEKGANKLWGGIPKDAKVENLEMKGDGGVGIEYLADLKKAMCEVSNTPETTLGGSTQAVSNTSGIALQYINLPLVEKTRAKRILTEDGFERLNELIILISLIKGLIKKPDKVQVRDLVKTEVDITETLPKDELLLIQQLEAELKLGLESRSGALKRLGREDITNKLIEIDKERMEHPELFGLTPHYSPTVDEVTGNLEAIKIANGDEELLEEVKGRQQQQQQAPLSSNKNVPKVNSGMTNGQTPKEEVTKETTGSNGKSK